MAAKLAKRLPRIVQSPHFWLLVAMFAIGTLLHYNEQVSFLESVQFGLTRHAMERVLFLLPITYGGFIYGLRGGLTCLVVAAVVMFPRAIFVSPAPADALIETTLVLVIGALVNTWFQGYEREKERRRVAMLWLEAAQEELRQHVAVIEKNEQRLATLNAISNLISQSLELNEILHLVSGRVMQIMSVEVILIYLLNVKEQELELEFYKGVSEEFVAGVRRVKVGEGFNGTVAKTGEPLMVEDATINPLLSREVVITEGIRSQLIVPLRSKGTVVGTLCVAKHTPWQFHTDEVELLSSIGYEIGVGLENARLYQETKQALGQLRQSEERYRYLFENASDAIWLHDLEGNVIAANRACENVTGYSSEELKGINVGQLIAEDSKPYIDEIEQGLLQNEPVDHRCEVELVKKGGAKAIVQMTTSLITRDGQPIGFQHAARDVTEERRMQENLRYYLEQLTRAQEEERKRIARELHDDTVQNLIVISRQLDKIASSDGELSEESPKHVANLKQQVEATLQGLRRFSHDLRPSVLDDLGLLPALELLASDLEKQGIATSFEVTGEARRLRPEVEVMLFRIAQEAVRNIWRHARASAAKLTIEFNDNEVRVSVSDNGKGFELPQRPGDLASLGKLGLAGMNERVRLVNGTLIVQSAPGKGTTVVAEVPL